VDILLGDPSKARKELDWSPLYTFEALVEEMVMEDLKIEQSRRD
jgi:GDPmannose 4,6-dehydratase